ncbi:MAG TPA: alpha/beta fold hydrolase [Actinomycetota bacterium]|nr:alpha/beta fold hydrolase [Actinomycetota bacterium]
MKTAKVLEGAEEFSLGEGPVGALIIHGFTSSPQVVRPIGAYLAERGIHAVAPRLPGHGTTWQDLGTCNERQWVEAVDSAFEELAATKEEVFIVGFSFGAALGIDLAARKQERVAGLATLASFLGTKDPRRFLAPVMSRVLKSIPGVGNDTADPEGDREIVYDRVPTAAVQCMLRFTKRARRALPQINCPLLVIHGRNDHTAPPLWAQVIHDTASSEKKDLVWLERSFHVLPFDYDREELLSRTFDFIKEHSVAL